MNDEDKYVAPPSEASIIRMSKIILSIFKSFFISIGNLFKQIGFAFKTPYRRLATGQKILKLMIQLVIAAIIILIAYIVLSIIIGIILVIAVLAMMGSSSKNDEIHVTDKWGGNKKKYRRY